MNKLNKILNLPFITHPLTIFTIVLLILNDHFFKQRFANELTGKISDFCGLYFFPLLLLAFITILVRVLKNINYTPKWQHLFFCIVITYLFFAGIQLSTGFTKFYENIILNLGFSAKVTQDPSDLIAFLSAIPLYFFNKNLKQ